MVSCRIQAVLCLISLSQILTHVLGLFAHTERAEQSFSFACGDARRRLVIQAYRNFHMQQGRTRRSVSGSSGRLLQERRVWTSLPTDNGWKQIYPLRFAGTLTSSSACWMRTGQRSFHRMIWSLFEALEGRMTQTRPQCSKDFNIFSFGPPPSWAIWTRRRGFLLKLYAKQQSICCTSLLQNSLFVAYLKSTKTSCCNGLRKSGSRTEPGLGSADFDNATSIGDCLTGWKWQSSDSTRAPQSEHVSIRDRRFWRRWRFKQGLYSYRPRGARARTFFAFSCTQFLSGLYQSWFGTSATLDTRLGPKSEPCVFRGGRHRVAASMLWFLIQMSMLEIAGGVRVVHSHPLCTGAMAGAGSPAVANGGGIFYEGKPPIFPKARKRAYMRALDRASANGGTWYRGRFLSLQQLQGHDRPRKEASSLREKHASTFEASRLRVVLWNCGGLHAARYQEVQEWLHEQEQAQRPVDIMILAETAWKSDMEYVTAPHPTSEARWFAIHSGSQSSQRGILCLISQRLACGSSLQHSSILQGRLLHVRIPLQTPLDVLCIYQYSWNTQKQFGDNTGRKVDALLKQRQSIWNHVRRWLNKIPQRNGCLLLGDFNTPLFQSGLQVGQGIVPIQKVAQTDQEVFQELVRTAGCCALNTWSKSGSAARTFTPAKGHDESGIQIDFVLARGRLADGMAKTCSTVEAPFTPCSGCRHIPLQRTISRPKPPFTPRQGKQLFNMKQVQQMMQQDSLTSHFKELAQSKVEDAETVVDMDHVLQQCWLETYERFRTVNEHRDGEPTSIVPSQHVNVNLVKQLWSTRAAIRQLYPLEPGSLRSLFEGWKLGARLQGICRQLRKASKLKRIEVVEAVVQSSDVFKAAKILLPKTPRRKLQLRDGDGNIQSREAESAQFAAFFRQLYAGPPSTTWSLQCSLDFSGGGGTFSH